MTPAKSFGMAGLVLLGVVSLFRVSDATEPQNPAATPLSRDMMRHKQILAIARKGNIDVVFLGDDITQRWSKDAGWKKYFEPLKAANFGVGGDQTGHVLWRITDGGELDPITPKVAVLMIGTNNAIKEHTAEQIADGIALIVKTIGEKTPKTKVLLLGILPRGPKPGTKVREKIGAVNNIIAKLDDGGKTVKYVDISGKLLQKDGTLMKEAMMPGFFNLSPMGYEIWAQSITPTLQQMLK